MATLQLQAQLLPPRDALPEHDLIPLRSTAVDWERTADNVVKWVESTEDVQILQVNFHGQARRIHSASLLKVKESFRSKASSGSFTARVREMMACTLPVAEPSLYQIAVRLKRNRGKIFCPLLLS